MPTYVAQWLKIDQLMCQYWLRMLKNLTMCTSNNMMKHYSIVRQHRDQ